MVTIEHLEKRMIDLEENQEHIIMLLNEIIDISRNKKTIISPNLLKEFNESKWEPPEHPGISNSSPIIYSNK